MPIDAERNSFLTTVGFLVSVFYSIFATFIAAMAVWAFIQFVERRVQDFKFQRRLDS